MSYRFVKVSTFYRDYLRDYYKRNPQIAQKPYSEQYYHLMSDRFGWSDYFEKNLGKIGIDAYELISNAYPLQNAWAKEKNLILTGNDLILSQLKHINPDIVFIQDINTFNGNWIKFIKNEIPSIRKIIGWCCSPYNKEQLSLYKVFDFMITCSPQFNIEFQKNGMKSFQLSHAFEPIILEQIKENNEHPIIDLLFTGSLIAGKDFHDERLYILNKLIESGIDISIYANLFHDNPSTLLAKQLIYLFSKSINKIKLKKLLLKNQTLKKINDLKQFPRNPKYPEKLINISKKPVYGLEMLKALSKAKISLNIHGGIAGDYAANIRLYEITGVGSCLLTDWKKNLDDIFDVDNEIVTFKNTQECIEKVKWLVDHPKDCQEIARAGQRRTLEEHTYENRIIQLDQIIKRELIS
jgi:spore maturation protein CgeB